MASTNNRIIDINSLTMPDIRENMAAGRQAFCLMSKYDVEWINNRENAAVAEAYLSQRAIPRNGSRLCKGHKDGTPPFS